MSEESKLFQKIQEHHKAIESEFAAIDAGDHDAVLKQAKERIAMQILEFTDGLVYLAKNADSESVRLAAIKFGFETLVGKDGKGTQKTAFDLIETLMAENDPPTV